MAKAQEARKVARADSLLDQVRGLQAKTLGILHKSEGAGDLRTAKAAIGQARQNLELLGRMAGELRTGKGTTVNVGVVLAQPAKPAGPDERARRIADRILDNPEFSRVASQFFLMMSEVEAEVEAETPNGHRPGRGY
jgi:hypothetical protein